MRYSYQQYTGDGSTSSFTFNLVGQDSGYISRNDLEVSVDGIDTPFTLTSSNTFTVSNAPVSGAVILIRRVRDSSQTYSVFKNGNYFDQDNLNKSFLHLLYLIQQIEDGFMGEGAWQVRNDVILRGDLDVYGDTSLRQGLDVLGDTELHGLTVHGDTLLEKPLDMGGNRIKNMGDSEQPGDATTRRELNSARQEILQDATNKVAAERAGRVASDAELDSRISEINSSLNRSPNYRLNTRYKAGETVTFNGSVYQVTKDYTSVDFQTDLVSGSLVVFPALTENSVKFAKIPNRVIDQTKTIQQWIEYYSRGVIYAEQFGVYGDDVDRPDEWNSMMDYITRNGGVVMLPRGTVRVSPRNVVNWFEGIKPFGIVGHGRASVLKFTNIDPPELGPTRNWTSEAALFNIGNGGGRGRYLPAVMLRDFCIDYSEQVNKGGTSRDTLDQCHPTPYSTGTHTAYFRWVSDLLIENLYVQEVYGMGFRIERCSHPRVIGNTLVNVSANNILTRYTGKTSSDSFGSGIAVRMGGAGVVKNNKVFNFREYKVDLAVDDNQNVRDTLCGYIGIQVEFSMVVDRRDPADYWDRWLDTNTNLGTKNTSTALVSVDSNVVYGYVLGVKWEADTTLSVTNNTILNCYVPIHTNVRPGNISGNFIDMQKAGSVICPQSGYEWRRGNIGLNPSNSERWDGRAPMLYGNIIVSDNRYPFFGCGRVGIFVSGGAAFSRGSIIPPLVSGGSGSGSSANVFQGLRVVHTGDATATMRSGFTGQRGMIMRDCYFYNATEYTHTLQFRSWSGDGWGTRILGCTFVGKWAVLLESAWSRFEGNTVTINAKNDTGFLEMNSRGCAAVNNYFRISADAAITPVLVSAHAISFCDNTIVAVDADVESPVVTRVVRATSPIQDFRAINNNIYDTEDFPLNLLSLYRGLEGFTYGANRFRSTTGRLLETWGAARPKGPFHETEPNYIPSGVLWPEGMTEPNLSSNISTVYTPYQMSRLYYVVGRSGSTANGVVYRDGAWTEF